jgi:NADPH-dependent 7-cyano-7-deazaguanine reductase QueF
MLKWLEKIILKKIVKRAIGNILDNEAATTIFVEEKINEIAEGIKKYVDGKVLQVVQETHDRLRETQK